MSFAGVGHGKYKVCHCWDCKHAPSRLQGKWKKAKNHLGRRLAKVEVREEVQVLQTEGKYLGWSSRGNRVELVEYGS